MARKRKRTNGWTLEWKEQQEVKAQKLIARRKKQREKHDKIRYYVLAYYSPGYTPHCSWEGCNITDVDMLVLDHIDNDGKESRKTIGTGLKLYKWIIENNYPEGLQTFCAGHNQKKEMMRNRALFNIWYPKKYMTQWRYDGLYKDPPPPPEDFFNEPEHD